VPHPTSALSIRGYADLVGRVIDEFGLVDPIVVGHSMGTQIVSDLASRRPEITTLVLIGPVVNAAERRIPTQAIRFLQSAWHEPGRVKFLAVSSYLLCGFKWFFRVLPRMMTFPLEDRLPLIQANTLVIRGEHDAVAPRGWVTRVGRLLPHSRSWEMPDSAHSVMHAHAEEVARLCVAFAEHPGTDDDTLRTYDLSADDIPDAEDEKPPADAVKGIAGRVTETVGILTDDDETIARNASCGLFDEIKDRQADMSLANLASDAFRRQYKSAEVDTIDKVVTWSPTQSQVLFTMKVQAARTSGGAERQAIAQILTQGDDTLVCSYLPRTGQF
jgi:hypothetical protein